MRRAARRDANEKEIVDALLRDGCLVERLSDPALPDLVVRSPRGLYMLEVKARKGTLTPAQVDFMTRWKACIGVDVFVVRTVNEALIAVGLAP